MPDAFPPTLHLAGSDMVNLLAKPKGSTDWWWTTCNHYNQRTNENSYAEDLLSRVTHAAVG